MDEEQLLFFKKVFDNSFYPYQYDIETNKVKLNQYVPSIIYFNNIEMAENITKKAREELRKCIKNFGI